jgi:addiction module HigA family antidote
LKGLNSTVTQAAKALKVAHNNLSAIFNERAGIRPEMAVKLSGSLGIYAQFWLNLQGNYDLWQAEQRVNRSRIQHFNPAA